MAYTQAPIDTTNISGIKTQVAANTKFAINTVNWKFNASLAWSLINAESSLRTSQTTSGPKTANTKIDKCVSVHHNRSSAVAGKPEGA